MCASEVIPAIKDIVLALAGATTAIVAVVGLRKWRQELHGKADFDVARALAKATYRLRDEFRKARSPLIRTAEFPSDYNSEGGKSPAQVAQAYAHVFTARWEPLSEALQDFDAQALEAEALWGAGIRAATEQVRTVVRVLSVATETYIADAASGGEDFSSDKEFAKQIRSDLFATPQESKNALSGKLGQAVQAVENELRPRLRRV